MLIDAHTHISFNNETKATVDGLLSAMDGAKVDKALVFAAEIFNCPTAKVIEATTKHRDRLFPIASVSDPEFNAQIALPELEGYLQQGLIHGLKVYTGYEHYYANAKFLHLYYKLFQKYHRPVIFHSGDTFCKHHKAKVRFADPIYIDDVATDFPDLPIIIAHLGWPQHINAAQVLLKNPNVYADCSGFVYGDFKPRDHRRFDKVIAEFVSVANGMDRIIFGSDWPISNTASYVEVMKLIMPNIEDESLNDAERTRSLFDQVIINSQLVSRLFGLEPK